MAKVFVVFQLDGDDSTVVGVFSSRKRADKYRKTLGEAELNTWLEYGHLGDYDSEEDFWEMFDQNTRVEAWKVDVG